MIRLRHVGYALPDRPLLSDVSFDLFAGERVGFIGRNGTGKTTLLRLITGDVQPDAGTIERSPPQLSLGYLRQGAVDQPDATVADVLAGPGDAWCLQQALASLREVLAAGPADVPTVLDRYVATEQRFIEAGGTSQAGVVHATLVGLDLAHLRADRPVRQLSGGQRTRLELARLLLEQPDLLVLDEPTNHLDVTGILWLESFLQRYRGAALLVSHDRVFLDAVVNRILALEDGTVQSHSGNYSAYRQAEARAEQVQVQTYRRQERERARLEEQIRREQERARRTELTTVDFALRAKAKKGARQAKVKTRRLERIVQSAAWVEKPQSDWEVRLDFQAVPPGSRQALLAEGLTLRYGDHTVLAGVDLRIQAGDRIVLTGPNGSGKSSLLQLLAGRREPDAGSVRRGESTRPGYLEQDQAELPLDATPLQLVRATSPLDETAARGYLHFFLFTGDQAFTPIGRLSYGERARLSLALILLGGANLLLLDEPLNHLDIPARERLEQALMQFPGASLTVAHDRAFIRHVATRILVLHGGRVTEYADAERFEAAIRRPAPVPANQAPGTPN